MRANIERKVGIVAFHMIRTDCYWHYQEHDMGASFDCCSLEEKMGECPCTVDCKNYITVKEVSKRLKYRIPTKVTHTATLYKCCTCPSCGNVVDCFDEWHGRKVRVMSAYCRFCGQALDWSDEDKPVISM